MKMESQWSTGMCQAIQSSKTDQSFSFDRIAEMMGVPSSSFIDIYSEKVTDLMVKLVEYVLTMDRFLNPTSGSDSGTGTGTGAAAGTGTIDGTAELPSNMIIQKSCILDKNENGYPILPDPIPSEGWKKTTWDSLFTDYIGQQYHLACGGRASHIPYKHISEDQEGFIENQYLPPKTIFRSPRNITLDEMKVIFDHFLQRQRKYGHEETFKFKSIKHKGKTIPASYSINSDEENTILTTIRTTVPTTTPILTTVPSTDPTTAPTTVPTAVSDRGPDPDPVHDTLNTTISNNHEPTPRRSNRISDSIASPPSVPAQPALRRGRSSHVPEPVAGPALRPRPRAITKKKN